MVLAAELIAVMATTKSPFTVVVIEAVGGVSTEVPPLPLLLTSTVGVPVMPLHSHPPMEATCEPPKLALIVSPDTNAVSRVLPKRVTDKPVRLTVFKFTQVLLLESVTLVAGLILLVATPTTTRWPRPAPPASTVKTSGLPVAVTVVPIVPVETKAIIRPPDLSLRHHPFGRV